MPEAQFDDVVADRRWDVSLPRRSGDGHPKSLPGR
jgi:hypothetical protein